jgi:2,4-dienoyl-CoA reductase-like NADH-dependent reductase (Old Yellow Enzyme family)
MIQGIARSRLTRRRFFVGLNSGYVTDGEPDKRYVDFYARRSSPELHCVIIGNVVIPGGYGSNVSTPTISRAPIWTSIARAISNRGSIPGIQLATVWEGYKGPRSFRPRDRTETIRLAQEMVRTLGTDHVTNILTSLEDGTSIALEAGFRHVQLHAAHGYLFSVLVDDRIYDGADEVLGRLAGWSQKTQSIGVDTSIRISLRTGDSHFDAIGRERFQDRIAAMPVNYVDASSGFYNIDKQLIYPARPDILLARRNETLALAGRHPEKQFILSGRALQKSEDTLPANVHLGLCRDLIANPDFILNTTRGCMNSGKCHYFSRGAAHITCPQWHKTYS